MRDLAWQLVDQEPEDGQEQAGQRTEGELPVLFEELPALGHLERAAPWEGQPRRPYPQTFPITEHLHDVRGGGNGPLTRMARAPTSEGPPSS